MYNQVENCLERLVKDLCLPGSLPKLIKNALKDVPELYEMKYEFVKGNYFRIGR